MQLFHHPLKTFLKIILISYFSFNSILTTKRDYCPVPVFLFLVAKTSLLEHTRIDNALNITKGMYKLLVM